MARHPLAEKLDENAGVIAPAMLGEPTSRSRRWLRFGRKGSIAVEIEGAKRGAFFDHETGEGGDMLALIQRQRGVDFAGAIEIAESLVGGVYVPPMRPRETERTLASETDDPAKRTASALPWWHEGRAITGTPAAEYLASRGVAYSGKELRWHPSCSFGKDRLGCMVALVRNIISDEPQAVHRTAVDHAGKKLSRLGSNGRLALGPVRGGAIKLTADADVTTVVGIGEGLETTLSMRRLPGLSELPIWSVLNANGVASFPVLPGIECVWIAVDNDESGTGQDAAHCAAERLNAAGVEVILVMPELAGSDLNSEVA